MNLIGNINAIPFRRFRGGGGVAPIPPFPSIPGMIARYSALGLTNEQMTANPVWKDLTGNGHDLQMKNFAWSRMSGVGGYSDVNVQTFYKFTPDNYFFVATKPGIKHMNFTFKVTGLQPGNKLSLAYFGTAATTYGEWKKDGIYTVNSAVVEVDKSVYFYNGINATKGEFTIEILPLYPGALVFDGVDDYGICDNFPILTKEKGYTVVVLRQFISKTVSAVASKWDRTESGAFLFEGCDLSYNYISKSFGGNDGKYMGLEKSLFSYMTSTSYNGKPITPGNGLDKLSTLAVGRYYNDINRHYLNAAIWELVFLDHDATEEELTKIKDYFVKTYPWLFPDQAWTVTGKTNEDEDRATIANITGNGNDLVLSNFGFIEGSGYNEEGEYAGYLVTDGVDDKIASSAFEMGEDFTVVGEWKLLPVSSYNYAGIVKSNNLYVYNNASIGLAVFIRSGGSVANRVEGIKSLKAICSDGRVYGEDWTEYKLNPGTTVGANTALNLGFNGSNFTQMAFKNLGIYNNQILSKNDCIKAYNYLQTLKAK